MKTKSLWFAVALGAALTGMTMMTSCSKDDYELPEVIESEVYDEGEAGEVRAEVGTEGTQLSYESWIMVRGITRASFDNKVSVTLNNRLEYVTGELDVAGWEEGTPELRISYKEGESRKDGFVTVTDSIMVCTVCYPDFSFDYELVFQTAVYDDGATCKTMPYYRYENIRDNGGRFTAAEKVSTDGKEYERRMLNHSIDVTFNGRVYTLEAELTLYKGRKNDVLVVSKVIDGGCEIVLSDNVSGKTVSWVEVEQEWSVSGKKTFRVEVQLNERMSHSLVEYDKIVGSQWSDMYNLDHELTADSVVTGKRTDGSVEITQIKMTHLILFTDKERDAKLFETFTALDFEVPVYRDEVLTYEMPYVKFTEFSYEISALGDKWESFGDGLRHPIKVMNYVYLGTPKWEPTGTDLNGDGRDDITGEEVDYVLTGAVKFAWTYSDYLYYK